MKVVKRILLVLVPLLLIGGTAVALAMMGIVKIPFLPFGKHKPVVAKRPVDDGKGGPFAPLFRASASAAKAVEAAQAREAAASPPPEAKPALDPGPGEAKLAGLWAALPTDRLVALVDKWPEAQLGRILAKMDEDATAKLLAALPAPRAASLSRVLAQATDEAKAR